ncbi:glycosyltransferase family 4 protein [Fulvivirga sp.]|uniref:glycosyltransferase family 4 protein n=1 Tax=Fulvivirga sp. TaxID=1931237 RepID=UPI0032EB192A
MNKKKVIFVFYQSKSQANGGINSLWQLIKSFDEIEPILLTNARTSVVEQAEALGYEFKITPTMDSFSLRARIYNVLFWSFTLLKLVSRGNIRAIHFNDIMALSYGVFSAKMTNLFKFKAEFKIIFNIRDVFEPGRLYTKKWKFVNYCDELIVLSEHMKRELYQRLPLNNKEYWRNHIHAIYSIVDLQRFSPANETEKNQLREKLTMDKDHLHWAYVATFNTKKNQLGFIQAMEQDLKAHDVMIHLVGDINEYAQECQLMVEKLGLEAKCIFHGYYKQVEDFYKAADLTIVPTKREGLARCMIESLACGKAVVSFNVSSAEEIIEENKCGIVVPQGVYDSFFQNAYELSNNKELLKKYSENGRNLATQLFSKPEIITSYQNIYLST